MDAPKVVLINRMLGHDGLNTAIKGYSGKVYGGVSRYSLEYKCHVVELTPAEYEAGREDIFRKMRSTMSGFGLWEPRFIAPAEKVVEMPKPEAPAAPKLDGAPKWNDLVKDAKARGIKLKKGGSMADLQKAIADHESAKNLAAAA